MLTNYNKTVGKIKTYIFSILVGLTVVIYFLGVIAHQDSKKKREAEIRLIITDAEKQLHDFQSK